MLQARRSILTSLGTLSLGAGKTLQGIGTVITSGISHTAGTITGGVSGTANSMGILTLTSGNLDLAGGTVRFDLSNSAAGTNDKIEANAGLTASAASILDVEFAAFPTTSQTYRLFDYTGSSVSGSASNFVLAGNGGRGVALNFATPGQVNLGVHAGLSIVELDLEQDRHRTATLGHSDHEELEQPHAVAARAMCFSMAIV